MISKDTEIIFYSPSRDAIYTLVKPAPRNPCLTGGPGDASIMAVASARDAAARAAAEEGALAAQTARKAVHGTAPLARDSLELVRVPRINRHRKGGCLRKLLRMLAKTS
jgi:hypothetical protein